MEINSNKQKLLLEYLVSSSDTFALCKSIVRAEYFEPSLRKAVDFVHTYYDKFSNTPNVEQIAAETGTKLKEQDVTRDQIAYCSTEVEAFCRRMAFQKALFAAPDLMQKGEYEVALKTMQDAIAVSLNKNMGVEYFKDPLSRLEKPALERTPTKWHKFDDALFGGIARTEILLFSANSGGGKSISLANLAVNFLSQKLNVLYITLELSEDLVAQRFDIMFTGIPSIQWQKKHDEIAQTLHIVAPHMGNLMIKHMPSGTTASAVRGYLKEFELKYGYTPDLLIVDYLDIMGTEEYVSADNVFEKDKRTTERLRDILFDYNMFGATASQQNRAAIDAEMLHQGHIAGGISKVNTVDVHVSILLNTSMKAEGTIGFLFLKTRNSDGVGKTIYLTWDNTHLRIMNPKEDLNIDEDGVIVDRVSLFKGNSSGKKTLDDLMDI